MLVLDVCTVCYIMLIVLFKQEAAYEIGIGHWSSDVCSSDLSPKNSFAAAIRTTTSGPCSVAISAACSPKSGGKTMNKGLFVAASMVAVIAAMPAGAQEAAAIEAAGEIVVTAQKRVQNVQDVPISIARSEEHTSELQSLMRTSYAVFCLKKKNHPSTNTNLELPKLTN